MKPTHLYNAKLGKVRWFVRRFGGRELILKSLRMVFAPVIIPFLPKGRFQFRGKELAYLLHRYNITWASERGVEVPAVRCYLETAGEKVLEIGNVLSHYGPIKHEVIDKFEKGDGVINEDIVHFHPGKQYDLIVSISTFEHIGYDDDAAGSSADKMQEAIRASRRLLSRSGKLVITAPIGYNPDLDRLLRQDQLGSAKEIYLKKYGRLDWRECPKQEALQAKYKDPFPYANAIVVAEFGPE